MKTFAEGWAAFWIWLQPSTSPVAMLGWVCGLTTLRLINDVVDACVRYLGWL